MIHVPMFHNLLKTFDLLEIHRILMTNTFVSVNCTVQLAIRDWFTVAVSGFDHKGGVDFVNGGGGYRKSLKL